MKSALVLFAALMHLGLPASAWGVGESARPRTSAAKAGEGLVGRLLPKHEKSFVFESIPADNGRDVFELETRGGKTVIRGNSGVSMAVGLNWYLKYFCRCHVSWCGRQLKLPDPLPKVQPKVRRTSWAPRRYFLNYCCFGYSLPWWDWPQWERLIDWMALNGVNMPLSVTGQEAVWQAVCKRLGLSDSQIGAFLAGPPYLPFGWMGCLDGWGGPLPQSWIDQHAELQKKILARQRAFGMTPVLQGFTGHVPPAVKDKFPKARLHKIRWIEWQTHLLDPLDPLYARIAKLFLEEQTKRFGTDHLYAADTFIEMVPPSGDEKFLASLSKAIYAGMTSTDPKAVWVLQGWAFMYKRSFWTQPRIKAFLDAVPNDRMIVLDLFCETTPMWTRTRAFCGKPWVWCNVQTFGCKVAMGGTLNRTAAALPAARRDPKAGRLVGAGFVNEGLDYNPVVYDLMFEMPWRKDAVDLNTWIRDYSRHRYGQANEDAEKAWRILKDTIYVAPQRGGSFITRVPTLRTGGVPRGHVSLGRAWRSLLRAADKLGDADTYRFDLVNITRQVLTNQAAVLHRDLADAHRAKDAKRFAEASGRFLRLIADLDELLATRKEFLLGPWLEDAKRWGAKPAERARFEWNARRVLTLWGTGKAIRDYARREWSGMLSGYYAKRWEVFCGQVGKALVAGKPFDNRAFAAKLLKWEFEWSDRTETYPTRPKGDSVAVARKLWAKYGGAFKPDAISLTTGKPVTCSHALGPHPANLANDGLARSTDSYWATDTAQHKEAWWRVDLGKPTTVSRVVVVGYYGDKRYYGFTVETSADGKAWRMVADRRDNKAFSTPKGYTCRFAARKVRYIRITQTHNSANTGRHLVEVMAYER